MYSCRVLEPENIGRAVLSLSLGTSGENCCLSPPVSSGSRSPLQLMHCNLCFFTPFFVFSFLLVFHFLRQGLSLQPWLTFEVLGLLACTPMLGSFCFLKERLFLDLGSILIPQDDLISGFLTYTCSDSFLTRVTLINTGVQEIDISFGGHYSACFSLQGITTKPQLLWCQSLPYLPFWDHGFQGGAGSLLRKGLRL